MDPQANIEAQRQLARAIQDWDDGKLERGSGRLIPWAVELAALVLALDEWRSKGGFDPYTATADNSVQATVVDGVVTCECGSTTFTYDEGHPSERTMAKNADGALVFNSDFEWFDGDDDPGVVCVGCGRPVTYPDSVTIDWSTG